MILFGINFSVYFLLLTKRWKNAFRIEEVRVYLGVILASSVLIAINVRPMFSSFFQSFHHAAFQVASIITTTGFSTVDFTSGRRSARRCWYCLCLSARAPVRPAAA